MPATSKRTARPGSPNQRSDERRDDLGHGLGRHPVDRREDRPVRRRRQRVLGDQVVAEAQVPPRRPDPDRAARPGPRSSQGSHEQGAGGAPGTARSPMADRGSRCPAPAISVRRIAGLTTGQCRVRSAAPISPARLPSCAWRISSIGRWPRPVSWPLNAARIGLEQQVAGLADAAADRRRRPGRARRSARRCPRRASGRASAAARWRTGRRRCAASVTSGPVIASTVAAGAVEQRAGASSDPPRAAARAPRAPAREPLAYCSRQPRLPQPHRMPSGTTRMWPISAPTPKAPR